MDFVSDENMHFRNKIWKSMPLNNLQNTNFTRKKCRQCAGLKLYIAQAVGPMGGSLLLQKMRESLWLYGQEKKNSFGISYYRESYPKERNGYKKQSVESRIISSFGSGSGVKKTSTLECQEQDKR